MKRLLSVLSLIIPLIIFSGLVFFFAVPILLVASLLLFPFLLRLPTYFSKTEVGEKKGESLVIDAEFKRES